MGKKWKMKFNLEKCHVIPITRNKTITQTKYMLHGQLRETVSQAKYLGVTITSDFRWNAHTNSISLTANRSLGFLRRNLSLVNPNKNSAYFTLSDQSWKIAVLSGTPTPLHKINKLEIIQHRAARYVLHRQKIHQV